MAEVEIQHKPPTTQIIVMSSRPPRMVAETVLPGEEDRVSAPLVA